MTVPSATDKNTAAYPGDVSNSVYGGRRCGCQRATSVKRTDMIVKPTAYHVWSDLAATPRKEGWWRRGGSNSRPSHCERDALPAELRPQRSKIIARCGPGRKRAAGGAWNNPR